MEIIGWIIWFIMVLFAISLTFGCWKYIKAGQGFQLATGVQALFFWIIAVLFLIFEWDKIHIIWMAPLSFFIAQFLAIGGRLSKK